MKHKKKIYAGVAPNFLIVFALFALFTGVAQAQINPVNDKFITQGMKEAPEVAKASNLDCQIINATFVANTTVKVNGANVKAKTYEVACKDSNGWLISKLANGAADNPMDCTSAATYAEKDNKLPKCRLPENTPHHKWLTARINKYLAKCSISKARLVGSSVEKKFSRFEVLCSDGRGGNIDVLGKIYSEQFEFKDCLMAEKTPSACKLQTREQSINQIKPLALAGDKSCDVNNIRFVGPSTDLDSLFYEVGCKNKSGFVLVISVNYAFKEARSCLTIAESKSPCQYTSLDNLAKEDNQKYTDLLAKYKITCNVTKYNLIGTQASSKRDYVEFLCPEKPFGLIGLVPQADSKAEIFMMDCFIAELKTNKCSLTSADLLKSHINVLVNKAMPERNCQVKEVRYEGEPVDAKDFIIVEVACENKRGYIIEINDKRTEITSSKACRLLKGNLKCTIPGNGTYSSDDA